MLHLRENFWCFCRNNFISANNILEITFQFSMFNIFFRQSSSWARKYSEVPLQSGDQFWTMGHFPPSAICPILPSKSLYCWIIILPSKSLYCWIIILPLYIVGYLWALLVVEKLRCVNMTDVCKYLSHADWHWHMWGAWGLKDDFEGIWN